MDRSFHDAINCLYLPQRINIVYMSVKYFLSIRYSLASIIVYRVPWKSRCLHSTKRGAHVCRLSVQSYGICRIPRRPGNNPPSGRWHDHDQRYASHWCFPGIRTFLYSLRNVLPGYLPCRTDEGHQFLCLGNRDICGSDSSIMPVDFFIPAPSRHKRLDNIHRKNHP